MQLKQHWLKIANDSFHHKAINLWHGNPAALVTMATRPRINRSCAWTCLVSPGERHTAANARTRQPDHDAVELSET